MTRKHLQWTDARPTLLRAVGRSGATYHLDQINPGWWALCRFEREGWDVDQIDAGTLADMKARAELMEADALGEAPTAQRVEWTKIEPGHYFGTAPVGLAYRITKIGRVAGDTLWRLVRFPNADAEHAAVVLDEGTLAALKRQAVDDATAAAGAPALAAGSTKESREGQQG